MSRGIGTLALFVTLVLSLAAFTGCVTVGEYERLKDDLAQAQEDLDVKNRQIEELDAGKRLYEEKALALEDELKRYRDHSAEADKIIEELNRELAAAKTGPTGTEGPVMEGVTLFKPESGGSAGIRLSDEILFDSGSNSLKDPGKKALNWVINELKKSNGRIEVRGHTDSDPVVKTKAKYPLGNIQLSSMRAMTVMDYLRKNGIPEDRISVSGFSQYDPLAPNDSKVNKAKNRRVEIILHAQ